MPWYSRLHYSPLYTFLVYTILSSVSGSVLVSSDGIHLPVVLFHLPNVKGCQARHNDLMGSLSLICIHQPFQKVFSLFHSVTERPKYKIFDDMKDL